MYPFERFSDAAKKSLTLAHQEAEHSHHSYIGSEHILLALLQEPHTVAYEVLQRLGVELGAVRVAIETLLGSREGMVIQQRIPTSRVKKIIELSIQEAKYSGEKQVGTGHLLLGILLEGEGIAAHVLDDAGAKLSAVHEMTDVIAREGQITEGSSSPGADRA